LRRFSPIFELSTLAGLHIDVHVLIVAAIVAAINKVSSRAFDSRPLHFGIDGLFVGTDENVHPV